ncbi:erythrocyte band 7 integral membrane protein-like isoform X2 [Otolemur garnettii]|uniref:erythrocyte band 7 integral membrane protein-like isoform X2 n=1 Tax=Otolemur garnettii TaxID=30611 RepID=UPI000643FF14|nr:erythrocyte band 7 integral membrane protein-like isoform X2 [Otolemur garnettii]
MSDKGLTEDSGAPRLPNTLRDSSPRRSFGPCGWILVAVSFLVTLITFPISMWLCIKIIKEAKVIAAEGEMNASRALKEASMIMTQSPAALELRYLQTLNTIAAEKNSTIIFPLPIDILQVIIGAKH